MEISKGFKPYFKGLALLGVVFMIYDTWLSGRFGWTISADLAGIFAAISIASGLLLVIAAYFWVTGHTKVGKVIAAAWVPVFLFNVFSNMGVATAHRMTDIQLASLQQSKKSMADNKVKENKALLAKWNGDLAKLKEQHGWAGTVSADGLKKQVASLETAAAAEAKLGGCGQKCRAIQNQISEINGRIAIAEQSGDLTKRIDALQRVVDGYRDDAAKTDPGVSQAQNQATFFAKLMQASLYSTPGSEDVAVANEGMGMATAIVLAILSALLTFVGAYPHLLGASLTRTAEAVQAVQQTVTQALPVFPAVTAQTSSQPVSVGFLPATPKMDPLAALAAGRGPSMTGLPA